MRSPSLSPLVVIGGGLCGGLAALALARRGFAVTLVAPPAELPGASPDEGHGATPEASSAPGSSSRPGAASRLKASSAHEPPSALGSSSAPGAAAAPASGPPTGFPPTGFLAKAFPATAFPVTAFPATAFPANAFPATAFPATALSYGALGGPGAWQAWDDLERLHGPLGLRQAALLHHSAGWLDGLPAALRAAPTRLWGLGRIDPPSLLAALPQALALNGVRRCGAVVLGLEPCSGGWRLALQTPAGPQGLETTRVVLAAGAGSRALWPALPDRLRVSWAGALLLADVPPTRWTRQGGLGRVVQPRHWKRPLLEAEATALEQERWIVDAGLAPRDRGLVVGQVSLVRPGTAAGEPPDPAAMEAQLRQGLRALDPALAHLAGRYQQVAVSFCVGGEPLVGPVANAPGLWAFTGFSGAFSRVPQAAATLAAALAAQAAG